MQTIASDLLPEIESRKLTFRTVAGKCLNIDCYRGYAPANQISSISQPDVYNQFSNPDGTQRELSIAKAKNAYAYMDTEGADVRTDQRFITEVVLNVRNEDVIEISDRGDGTADVTILLDRLTDSEEEPDIARVEGNHRLTYARGYKNLPALTVPISFCMMVGVNKLMEAKIFRDINSNQKPMQTSHLDNIDIRLDDMGGREAPEQTKIAFKLSKDLSSPFLDIVYKGGKKVSGTKLPITLRSLAGLVKIMQSKSDKLTERDFDEQYTLIRAYWKVIANIFKAEWEDKGQKYLMMRSAGTIALAMAGATTIDDLSVLQKLSQIPEYLEPLRGRVDWRKDGPCQGLNGVGGASIIFKKFLRPHLRVQNVDDADLKSQIALLNDI